MRRNDKMNSCGKGMDSFFGFERKSFL